VIVIYGWLKEAKEIGAAPFFYCFRCQRKRTWEHWRETEWVTFFAVKTVPFLWKNHAVCGACRQPLPLNGDDMQLLRDKAQWPSLVTALEERQLADKNEIQRKFLLAQRAERDPG
jgi:hypothetical protein